LITIVSLVSSRGKKREGIRKERREKEERKE